MKSPSDPQSVGNLPPKPAQQAASKPLETWRPLKPGFEISSMGRLRTIDMKPAE